MVVWQAVFWKTILSWAKDVKPRLVRKHIFCPRWPRPSFAHQPSRDPSMWAFNLLFTSFHHHLADSYFLNSYALHWSECLHECQTQRIVPFPRALVSKYSFNQQYSALGRYPFSIEDRIPATIRLLVECCRLHMNAFCCGWNIQWWSFYTRSPDVQATRIVCVTRKAGLEKCYRFKFGSSTVHTS